MKKLRHIILYSLLLLAGSLPAQDAQILSRSDLIGTARYVSLAGAMTAVGGDPSAVKDNPAALGVYRRLEVSLTVAEELDRVHQFETPQRIGSYNTFTATQASFVFSLMNTGKVRGLIANNFIISYHRLANFNRQYSAGYADEQMSLTDVAALKTDGLQETALQPENRWDDSEVGWLSCQAYDTYLINPDGTKWYSVLETGQQITTHINIKESGYVNQYSLGWGGNISNKLFLGLTLNVMSLYHNQSVMYYEDFGSNTGLDNNTYVSHSGVGVNAAVGIIAHPLRWLRIGYSLTTPSAMSTTTTSYGDMRSYLYFTDSTGVSNLTNFTSSTPQNRRTDRSLRLPLRTSFGLAFQLKNYGLLSLQYDYAHMKGIKDDHTVRVGLEGVIVNRFFLSAGYAFEGSTVGWNNVFGAKSYVEAPEQLAYNTVRTDAYSQFVNHSHYVTAGFGYRSTHVAVHVAYRLRLQQADTYAHELATPYDLRAKSHSIVVSFAFHTR